MFGVKTKRIEQLERECVVLRAQVRNQRYALQSICPHEHETYSIDENHCFQVHQKTCNVCGLTHVLSREDYLEGIVEKSLEKLEVIDENRKKKRD